MTDLVSYATDIGPGVTGNTSVGAQPLVLDLDGTVVRGNLLVETALDFVRRHPLQVFMLFVWLLRGKAELKHQLAQRTDIDVETLPLNEELIDFARAEAKRGREVYIATAADQAIAERIARRIPFLTGVIGSTRKNNLKGTAKATDLVSRFPHGFDYAGDARADLAVWSVASSAIVVEAAPGVVSAVDRIARVAKVFPRQSPVRALMRSLRLHQWAKNALVFVPLVLSGQFSNTPALLATITAFVSVGLIASATYIINDVFDLADDRRHWSKKNRPLASGRLPLLSGLGAATVMLAAGLTLALLVHPGVALVLALYIACTLGYSLWLKRLPILDGFALASLFTLRLGVGIVASGAPPSPWLLVFSMFLFASLSFAKRHTEVARVIERGGTEIGGRGYRVTDLPFILSVGIATGMCSVLILVLYIIEDAFSLSFYGDTMWLWGFPAVLFLFVCRIWLVCQRGEMHDDPVAFAVKDRASLGLAAVLGVCFVAAWSGFSLT